MNRTRTVVVALTLAVAGCATTPDCTDAERSARAQGQIGQPLPAGTAACPGARTRWQDALAEFCTPANGFDLGLDGGARPTACEQPPVDHAFNLGQAIHDYRAELEDIEREFGSQDLDENRSRTLRRQQITLQRDLPQLEALARLEGWLPPAHAPGSSPDPKADSGSDRDSKQY